MATVTPQFDIHCCSWNYKIVRLEGELDIQVSITFPRQLHITRKNLLTTAVPLTLAKEDDDASPGYNQH